MANSVPATDAAPVTAERQTRLRQPNAAACASSRMARLFSFVLFILVGSFVYAAHGRMLLRQTLQLRSGGRAASVRLSDMMSMGESASSHGDKRRQLLVSMSDGYTASQHQIPGVDASSHAQHLPVPAYGALHSQAVQLLQTATAALRSTESVLAHLLTKWQDANPHKAAQNDNVDVNQARHSKHEDVGLDIRAIGLEAICQQALTISNQALTAVEDCIQRICMYLPGCKGQHMVAMADSS